METLFPLIDPAADRFPEEQPAFRVEAFFSRWTGTPLLENFKGPVDLREFKVTRIEIRSKQPLTLRCHIRFEVGRRTEESPAARIGEAEVDLVEEAGQLRAAATRTIQARDVSLPRRLYREVTGSVFAACPSFSAQLAVGTDEWRQRLDGASGIDVYGNCGLAAGDIDGDGWDDIYICQPAGLPNRLYRNRRDGTFEDVTDAAGVGVLDHTAAALFVDFDNRGHQDLLVVCSSGPLLFRNNGEGRFTLQPEAFPFAQAPQGTFTGAAAADFDSDGRVDVYFCLYSYYQGLDQYRFPLPYHDARNGPPNFLFHNRGNGRFADVTAASGMHVNNDRFSFACSWCDFENNGRPGLYVANDFGVKNLYRNNGDGTFTDIAQQSGVEDIGAGMSAAWADWHGSGHQDLYVANMWTAEGLRLTSTQDFHSTLSPDARRQYRKHAMGNSLFRNAGDGRFSDATVLSGTGFGRWSWGSDAIGQDLYVTNGMITGTGGPELNSFFWRQVVGKSPETATRKSAYQQGWSALNERIRAGDSWSGAERNVYFRNRGQGTFEDVSACSGLDTSADSRAFVLTDIDGDGRPELVLKNRTGPQVQVFARHTEEAFLAVRLRGTRSNRDAIGAAVSVEGAFMQEVRAGSGFLAQHAKELFFPLGKRKGFVSLRVRWPSGAVQNVEQVPVNSRIEIVEDRDGFSTQRTRSALAPAPAPAAAKGTPSAGVWLLAPLAAWPVTGYAFPPVPNLLVLAGEGCPVPRSGIPEKRLTPESMLEYSVIYRYLFDVRRELPLPTAFLIDDRQQIRKVYAGGWSAERIQSDVRLLNQAPGTLALPFRGQYHLREAFEPKYFNYGVAFHTRGLLRAAEFAFKAALERKPDYPEALYSLGSIYLAQRKAAEAKAQFAEAVRLRPGYAEAWNNLGVVAAEAGDAKEAGKCWQEVVRLQPDNALGHLNLGTLYRRLGRFPAAQDALELAARLDPEDGEVPYQLGMLAAQQGRVREAEELLRHSLELRETSGETLNNLAILLVRSRRVEEASELLTRSIKVAPDFGQAYLNLARIHAGRGQTVEARQLLEQLLSRQPDDAEARAMLDRLR
jgi:tetratricopeptide (TPR) repeat protein